MSQFSAPRYQSFRIAALAVVFLGVVPPALAQKPLQYNVFYTCNGTRITVRSCALGNSDNPANDCIVQFPDKPRQPTGHMATTLILHSNMVKLIQTCKEGGQAPADNAGMGVPGGPGRPGGGFNGGPYRPPTPSIWTQIGSIIGTGLSVLIMVLFVAGVLALIGWWAYKKIYYSRYLVVRRSNKQAIEEFGLDPTTREQNIVQTFESMDKIFRLVGENRNKQYMMRFTLLKNIRTFKRKDLECLRFAYFAYNRGVISDEMFYTYRITAIYQSGQTDASPPEYLGLLGFWRARKKQGEIGRVRSAVQGWAAANCTPNLHNQTYAQIQQLVLNHPNDEFYIDMERRFREGARWMGIADIKRSLFKVPDPPTPFYEHFGILEGTRDTMLTYSGDGSLMTIAQPGSGKTTCNVIPNLLRWPGAAVVLDVKGEIYETTSKFRSTIGPIIKFSLLDPRSSKCYNPLAFIRREAIHVWEDARSTANMLMPQGYGGDKNKTFEDNARSIMTAIMADMAFWHKPEDRPISQMMRLLNRNGWDEFLDRLRKNPEVTAMQDLGVSLAKEHPENLSNFLAFARGSVESWLGEGIAMITKRSDWHPADLRSSKHPTIYICATSKQIEDYASLLRVFIGQHIDALMAQGVPTRDADPILFCLDEFPSLGGMKPIETALAMGRGYKLRLWLFAQDADQIEKAYGNAKRIMNLCLVRTFMNPTVESAELVAKEIGEAGVASGVDEGSSVSPQELSGPAFQNIQFVVGQGSKPSKVHKAYWFNDPQMKMRAGSIDDVRPSSRPAGGSAQAGASAGA